MIYLVIAIGIILLLSILFAVIKGLFNKVIGLVLSLIITAGTWYVSHQIRQAVITEAKTQIETAVKEKGFLEKIQEIVGDKKTTVAVVGNTNKENNIYFVERLTGAERSSVDENGQPVGSAKYGATFVLGDLDEYGRATYAHILVSDAQEPGQNGESRPGKIHVDPADWKNYKFNNVWVNDRTHTVGYQFGGVNSDPRVLTTAGAYLNRGTEGRGSDETNIESMLYYEQQLDSWLANHPNFKLDLYVRPIYEGKSGVVRQMYMQWVGVDSDNNTIPINIGGKSKLNNDYYYVILDNVFPSYTIDYQTGYVTEK